MTRPSNTQLPKGPSSLRQHVSPLPFTPRAGGSAQLSSAARDKQCSGTVQASERSSQRLLSSSKVFTPTLAVSGRRVGCATRPHSAAGRLAQNMSRAAGLAPNAASSSPHAIGSPRARSALAQVAGTHSNIATDEAERAATPLATEHGAGQSMTDASGSGLLLPSGVLAAAADTANVVDFEGTRAPELVAPLAQETANAVLPVVVELKAAVPAAQPDVGHHGPQITDMR